MLDSTPRAMQASLAQYGRPTTRCVPQERVARAPNSAPRTLRNDSSESRFCPHFVTFANNRMTRSRNLPIGLRHNRNEMPTPSEHQPQHLAPGDSGPTGAQLASSAATFGLL